jgi:hypothetical protein
MLSLKGQLSGSNSVGRMPASQAGGNWRPNPCLPAKLIPRPTFAITYVVATALLLAAEFTLVLWLRGLTTSRDLVGGTVYIVMLAAFAIMPLLLARR